MKGGWQFLPMAEARGFLAAYFMKKKTLENIQRFTKCFNDTYTEIVKNYKFVKGAMNNMKIIVDQLQYSTNLKKDLEDLYIILHGQIGIAEDLSNLKGMEGAVMLGKLIVLLDFFEFFILNGENFLKEMECDE